MDKLVSLSAGSFRAQIDPEQLCRLPLYKTRRLFRLIWRHQWENWEALQALEVSLADQVSRAKEAWAAASRAYTNGWKLVPGSARTARAKQDRANNAELAANLKRAKAHYERVVKLQTIFHTEQGNNPI